MIVEFAGHSKSRPRRGASASSAARPRRFPAAIAAGSSALLLHQPNVLLMDELTVGLDPASRSDLLKLLMAMQIERSVAVPWATHLVD